MSRRCVFLDRDGVINVKPDDGQYVCRWSDFRWIPNTVDWIRLFNALDLLVIVVTNQRGVVRGLLQRQVLDQIHDQMIQTLAHQDARIDDIFVCPHEIGACNCRKPLPGMIHAARDKWDIDVSTSLMIGDSDSDQQLAAACGLTFLRAKDGQLINVPMEAAIDGAGDSHVG